MECLGSTLVRRSRRKSTSTLNSRSNSSKKIEYSSRKPNQQYLSIYSFITSIASSYASSIYEWNQIAIESETYSIEDGG
jgi:hypothetical protein